MALRVRNFAATAAGELNSGTPWANMVAIQPEGLPLTLVKQDLVDNVKLTYDQVMAQEGGITSGDVVAHDNGTTQGLWRADADTTAEPTKDSSDWTLVFEITV
jgi:NADH:ubiquinone oxidoreductase subunit F (NADH-binding)